MALVGGSGCGGGGLGDSGGLSDSGQLGTVGDWGTGGYFPKKIRRLQNVLKRLKHEKNQNKFLPVMTITKCS